MRSADCFICRNFADQDAPERERILRTGHWRVAHAIDAGIEGWLIFAPLQHVRALDELAPDAAAELGPALRDLTSALRHVTKCGKTCVLHLAEQEGFAHLHFHVVPRAVDLDPELRGIGIMAMLRPLDASRVRSSRQDEIALEIQAALTHL